jgi:mono/diheme cytochrome c family protein
MTSSRSPLRSVLRWSGRIGLSLVVLLALAAGTVYALSARLMNERFEVPAHPIAVRTDSATIARGAHLATIRGCTDCHGANLRGNVMLDDPAVGRIAGPNLTAGGRGRDLTDADWERAVRHGVRRDGSALAVMPANEFNVFTDEDLAAIVAYARSLPADPNVAPATSPGPVLRALHAAGEVPLLPAKAIDHAAPHAATIAVEPTVAYGQYIAVGCQGCHNPSFSGGKIPGTPPDWKPSANITPAGIGHYSEADFITALRTGRRPDGSAIDPQMPIATMTSKMTDTELRAMYAYLRTVPAKQYGER